MILLFLPLVLQAIVMAFDEIYFHRKRGLGRWERLGHPIDSLSFAICVLIAFLNVGQIENVRTLYILACAVSCLVITKDEFVHAKECDGIENWLHSLLFVLHPICLFSIWLLAADGSGTALLGLLVGVLGFMAYQILYWNILQAKVSHPQINNDVYETLGEAWYTADADPIALLRSEAKLKNPWVEREIQSRLGPGSKKVLDIGCGAGFLSNHLAHVGHKVSGLDASASSLETARKYDSTKTVDYISGDAYALPFPAGSFDVVCAMDFLEHVEDPAAVIREASRVLAPGGLLFFHTFNRNWLSGFVVIRLMEWFVKGTPKHLHVYRLFIRPSELKSYCAESNVKVTALTGIRPRLFSLAALKVLIHGSVREDFQFDLTRSLLVGYLGIGEKLVQEQIL
jgi:2-polyprenyl-6-hydroxyphenyl methylase/3-demethylubiquinone-9 3-methyltransferase